MVIVLTSEVIKFECGTRHFVKWEKRQFLIVKCGTGTDGHQWNEWKKVTSNEIQNFGKYIVVATKVIFVFIVFFFANCSMSKNLPKKKKTKISKHPTYTPAPTSRTKIICYLCVQECEKRVCINGLQREILCEKTIAVLGCTTKK